MTFKPNGNWVLIPDPTKTKTESGIILDDETARKQSTNVLKVLKVGPDCKFVKEDDTVLIDPRTEAVRSTIDDCNYLLIQEFQVLGIL
jgi:co-chaperonin GroES (HSP10)